MEMYCVNKSVILEVGPQAHRMTRNLREMQFPVSTQNLLNQKFWEWGPETCILSRPRGNSDTCSSLKTTALDVHTEKKENG